MLRATSSHREILQTDLSNIGFYDIKLSCNVSFHLEIQGRTIPRVLGLPKFSLC